MPEDIILDAPKIPLVGEVFEQELIIKFSKGPDGEGNVNFSFKPDIIEAISPEQRAAMNVAEQIINMFGLNREDEQNAESSDTEQ